MSNSVPLLFSVSPAFSQKERHPSLSLEELKFLSQLTESFVKVENNIQELFEETLSLLKMPKSCPGMVLFSGVCMDMFLWLLSHINLYHYLKEVCCEVV